MTRSRKRQRRGPFHLVRFDEQFDIVIRAGGHSINQWLGYRDYGCIEAARRFAADLGNHLIHCVAAVAVELEPNGCGRSLRLQPCQCFLKRHLRADA